MADTNEDGDLRRRLVTPASGCERVSRDRATDRRARSSERRERSHTMQGCRHRQRTRTRDSQHSHRQVRERRRGAIESRPSRSRSRHVSRRSRREDLSRERGRVLRKSRSHSRRTYNVHDCSRSGSKISRSNLYERLELLEKEINRERNIRNMVSKLSNKMVQVRPSKSKLKNPAMLHITSPNNSIVHGKDSPNFESEPEPKEPRSETSKLLELFTDFLKNKGGDRESFPVLNNVIPEFDPLLKEQTITVWLSKVDESAEIYNWSYEQIIHYALPKLTGVAKTWYQGLPSIKHSWPEWKQMLRSAFPSDENYAELLTRMLAKRTRPRESLELYYFSKINLLNRCKIFGKNAVDCIVFGIKDKGVRSSTQACKFDKPEEMLKFFKTVIVQNKKDIELRKDFID